MSKKMKRSAMEDESSSSTRASSSDDDISREESARHRRRRSQARRNTSKKERSCSHGKAIKKLQAVLLEEMHKQSNQDTQSKQEICKQLEKVQEELAEIRNHLFKQRELHTNGTRGDDYDAPRSHLSPVQPPRYRLVFKSEVADKIEKGQTIEISIALVDGYNDQTVENGPLASATVELVVVNAEFNQHNNQYNWSRDDFESNIKKARQGNSATVDVDQSVKSIVSDGRFNLVQGFMCHRGSKIFSNSSNKKVRLGVMVVSPTEERVLEGLSNPFFVRGHDRPARQSNLRHNRSNTQNHHNVLSSPSGMNTTTEQLQLPFVSSGLNTNEEQQLLFLGNTPMLSAEPSTSQEQRAPIQHYHFHRLPTMAQEATNNQIDAFSPSALVGHLENPNYMGNSLVPVHEVGMQFSMNQRVLPVQLLWDRPNVEPSKRRWDLVDHLITPPQKHLGSLSLLASIQKSVLQTRRKSGVLIEPLKPDDFDEQRPLKRKRHSKYQLRFVNKARKTYYTRDQIKADDGNLLMVALFDENNTKITYGPLSSASVEVVALHGDFNVDGQDYWTSEEFSRSVVSPPPGEEASSVIGGDLILVLADGEACLRDAFFQRTSLCARTEKFKMGVMLLASAQEERIQEGISESFRVIDRGAEELPRREGAITDKALPAGFRFNPTDGELIVHYLCHRDAAKSLDVHYIAEVDVYKFDPWDLPAKAVFGDHEWYFYSPLKRYPNSDRPNRAAGSGYWNWKTTGAIPASAHNGKMVGFKKTLVFYKGVPPKGEETGWVMHEYHRLSAKTCGPTTCSSDTEGSSTSISSTKLDERVLCRIFRKARPEVQYSSYEHGAHLQKVRRLGQQLPEFSSYTDLPRGFRFHPTDKELILDYLLRRATGAPCRAPVIAEVDIYKFEPWELPSRAAYGEREWYFFHRFQFVHAAGTRSNHATAAGYWKATGTDKPITLSADGDDTTLKTLGIKRALVFYRGRPPMGIKTDWIMHEYRLHNNATLSSNKPASSSTSSKSDVWVLCRLYKKMSHIPPEQQQIDHAAVPPKMEDDFSDALLPPLSTMPSTSSSVSECITNLTNTPSTSEPPSSPSSLW